MPPPFVWLDGCTPLHIHTSVDKYNLAYFISNRRRDSGSYVTYLDISVTHFDWNQYASKLALARLLTLGFVLMHTLAWSFWKRFAYSFLASRAVAALVCFPALFEEDKSKCSKHGFCWIHSVSSVLFSSTWFYRGAFSPPQPFVLGAVEPQQPVVLFMRACLNQSAEFSIFHQPTRSWSSTLARLNNYDNTTL